MATIDISCHVAATPSLCFDLARSVDAHVYSSRATGERVTGAITTGLLTLGDEVTWRARHLGVWQELTSRITQYDRPIHFRDSMVRGAFAHFDHDHSFSAEHGGTLCKEVFAYRAPLGPLGVIAERTFLTEYMRRFLTTRMGLLKQLAESGEWKQFVSGGHSYSDHHQSLI